MIRTRNPDRPFWRHKSLEQMTVPEWESLCDGCGLCCLIRFEDEDTGEVIPTRVHCQLFDPAKCQCSDYANRRATVPDCIKLTPHNIEALQWMPRSCAYRRLYEGKDLPAWHPLVTGDMDSTHKAGISIKDQTLSERIFSEAEEALDFAAWDLMGDKGDWPWDPAMTEDRG